MNNQEIYRTSALRGSMIGVLVAFIVILLATWSPVTSILVTHTHVHTSTIPSHPRILSPNPRAHLHTRVLGAPTYSCKSCTENASAVCDTADHVQASLNICCVLVSVIGFTTMLGWELGTIQSILISILAGFSVDYVVHLAHAYCHAHGTRQQRVVSAFSEMGSPVMRCERE